VVKRSVVFDKDEIVEQVGWRIQETGDGFYKWADSIEGDEKGRVAIVVFVYEREKGDHFRRMN